MNTMHINDGPLVLNSNFHSQVLYIIKLNCLFSVNKLFPYRKTVQFYYIFLKCEAPVFSLYLHLYLTMKSNDQQSTIIAPQERI